MVLEIGEAVGGEKETLVFRMHNTQMKSGGFEFKVDGGTGFGQKVESS